MKPRNGKRVHGARGTTNKATGTPEQPGSHRAAITLLQFDRDKKDPEKRIFNPKVLVDGPFGVVEQMDVKWHFEELHSAVYSGADVVMTSPPGTYSVFLSRPRQRASSAIRPPNEANHGPNGELIYEAYDLSVRFDAYLTTVSAEKLVIHGDILTFFGKKIIVSFRAQISSES